MPVVPEQLRRILIAAIIACVATGVLVMALAVAAERNSSARLGNNAALAASVAATAPAPVVPPASQPATPTSPAGAPLSAYQGLGSWVDVYDERAWRSPKSTVADMASHGVRTLYVQTGYANMRDPFFNVKKLQQFIVEAHGRGMYVVAWYLPNMKAHSVDFARIRMAADLRTSDGQKFDSLAIDIESSDIKSEAMRNHALQALSTKVRAYVGPTYPLGAIVPAPVGLRKENSVWHNFPYTAIAGVYDVFLPMSYYTYHGHSTSTAYSDVRGNLAILRGQPGCANTPIHLIGGEAQSSSADQVAAFAKGVREGHVLGWSLYTWPGVTKTDWKLLWAIAPVPR